MDVLSQIRKPIEAELESFKNLFDFTLQHRNPLLETALRHVLGRKGKMMRPILLFLAAKKCGPVTDQALHAAVSLEMLHTASLVHDDVVDESAERRGQKSVNALLDNKAAVLVGDYMLSTALKHAALTGNIRVVELISWLGQALSDGELQQLANIQSEEISEEQYFEVIRKKTASLFAVSAQIGAMLAGGSEEDVEKARLFGEYIGLCFQIRDDIFDYYTDQEVGKPTGNDMKEGKLTLPVIYSVLKSDNEQWKQLAYKVRSRTANDEEIAALVEFTKESGGIEYARQKMEDIRQTAFSLLGENGDEAVNEALRLYLDFVLKRVS